MGQGLQPAFAATWATRKKPRFTRVVKDGKLYLRDREPKPRLVGPFASWADALAHMKRP